MNMRTTILSRWRFVLTLICIGASLMMVHAEEGQSTSWKKQFKRYYFKDHKGNSDTLAADAWKAFHLAREHGDVAFQLAAMGKLSNTSVTDSFPHYLTVIDTFPKSILKTSVYTSLQMKYYNRRFKETKSREEKHDFIQELMLEADCAYADSVAVKTLDDKTIYLLNNRVYLDVIVKNAHIDSKDSPLYPYAERLNNIIEELPASNMTTKINTYVTTSGLALKLHDYEKTLELSERVKSYVLSVRKSAKTFQELPIPYASICYNMCYQQIQCYDLISDSLLASNWEFMDSPVGHICRERLRGEGVSVNVTPLPYYYMARKMYGEVIAITEDYILKSYDNVTKRQRFVDLQSEAINRCANSENYLDRMHRNFRFTAEYQAYSRDDQAVDYGRLLDLHQLNERIAMDELQKQKKTVLRFYLQFGAISIILLIALWGVYSVYQSHKKRQKLIEQLKLATNKTETEKEKTERAKQMQTVCLDNMNHEIRTPLNSIAGFSQLLIEEPELDAEIKQEYAEQITTSSNMLLKIINDVLDTAQLETGQYKLDNDHWNVREICEYAIFSMETRLSAGVEMRLDYRLEDDTSIYVDKTRLLQILLNFLSNACKHTEEGSITLSCRWEESSSENEIRFMVCDTGLGVPEDKQEHLFERFAKLNHKVQGTGLGLNIAATLAHVMHAEIGYDSSYTDGACFYVVMPKEG